MDTAIVEVTCTSTEQNYSLLGISANCHEVHVIFLVLLQLMTVDFKNCFFLLLFVIFDDYQCSKKKSPLCDAYVILIIFVIIVYSVLLKF